MVDTHEGFSPMTSTLYTADTHFGHENIIHYTKRPFVDVNHMDVVLLAHLRAAELTGAPIVHAGDLCFALWDFLNKYGPIFGTPLGKSIIPGNHDRLGNPTRYEAYRSQFATVVGTEKHWKTHALVVDDWLDDRRVKVLVSHKPQENLWGADVNVFGHVHNNVLFPGEGHHPEDDWAFVSEEHFCACVELHDFKPVSLQQLADEKRAGYPRAHASVARYRELHPNPPQRGARES